MMKKNIVKKMFALKIQFEEKGFIGAIGDDLPSLIPIIFALLIFFTAFSAALGMYNSENAQVSTEMGMLSIARVLKGDSLLLNVNQFLGRCDDVKIGKYPYNYMVAVYKADEDLDGVIDDFIETEIDGYISPSFLKGELNGNQESYFCGYKRLGSKNFGDTVGSKAREEYIMRYYPIAIQTKVLIDGKEYYVIIPGIMAMVIW